MLRFLITIVSFIVTICVSHLHAQSVSSIEQNTSVEIPNDKSTGTIVGEVKDSSGFTVEFAKIRISSADLTTYSDVEGNFRLENVPIGFNTIEVSTLGFEAKVVQVFVETDQTSSLVIDMKESSIVLDAVSIDVMTEEEEKAEQPVQVTVLSAEEVRDQPIGVIDLVKKSTGVLIRQQGALGSPTSIQLNGLSGRSVRIYYDGIPIEFLGGASLGLNSIPISLIDRVEVYKGVMPIEIGTDALGGGINIVSRRVYGNFLEANYQVGSFNTHRFSVVGKKIVGKDLIIGTQIFYNSSDNDYLMKDISNTSFEVIDNIFGRRDTIVKETTEDVRRFHNKHRSYYASVNAQVYDKKWTDKLGVSLNYANIFDQLQHGTRVLRSPYGEVETKSNQVSGILNYQKTFGKHLTFSQISNLSFSRDFVEDSTSNIYDWNGNILPFVEERGAEISDPVSRKGKDLGTSHRSIIKYSFDNRQHVSVSNIYGFRQIWGTDPYADLLTVNGVEIDPNEIKSPIRTNIFGLQYDATWFKKDKLNTLIFYKKYNLNVETIDANALSTSFNDDLPTINITSSFHGAGLAIKYDLTNQLILRTSYERATRLPVSGEVFGNFAQIRPNLELQAERSNNVNIGLRFKTEQNKRFKYGLDLNVFLRDQEDLIRLHSFGDGTFSQYINEGEVLSRGIELGLNVAPLKRLNIRLNFTFQDVFISNSEKIEEESIVGVKLPNIPGLFFNTSLSYSFSDVFYKKDQLNIFCNYFFVDAFSVTYVLDPSNANPDNIVPTQHDYRIGLSYKENKHGLTLSVQLNNVLNNVLYDNFKVPKPGRNIMLKLSYLLNQKDKS